MAASVRLGAVLTVNKANEQLSRRKRVVSVLLPRETIRWVHLNYLERKMNHWIQTPIKNHSDYEKDIFLFFLNKRGNIDPTYGVARH